MRKYCVIWLIFSFACEEVVDVKLPFSENLIVVEGFITDSLETQKVQLSRSAGFSSAVNLNPIEFAQVEVLSQSGDRFELTHISNGVYESTTAFAGVEGMAYRLSVELGQRTIESDWDLMQAPIDNFILEVASFQENDPDSGNEVTIFYPKVTAADPANIKNHYRWILYKNDQVFREPEPISIQDDRFFDGNLIPNNFQDFAYAPGDKISIELLAISQTSYQFLDLLKSQITTLGTSSGTTPAIVKGNLNFTDNPGQVVLGYFGTVAVREKSVFVPE